MSTQGPKGQGREGLSRSEPVSSHSEPVPHDTVPEVSGPQLQPDVVTAEIPGQGAVRTAHVRVSKRVPLVELRLKPYGPIYNELEPKVSNKNLISMCIYIHLSNNNKVKEMCCEYIYTHKSTFYCDNNSNNIINYYYYNKIIFIVL